MSGTGDRPVRSPIPGRGGLGPGRRSRSRRGRLEGRLRRLRNWEAVNVFLMPAIALWIWPEIDDPARRLIRAPALFMVSLLLAQGVLYWHIKHRSVRNREPLPAGFGRFFGHMRTLARGGLLASGGALLTALALGHGSVADFAWGVGLLGFATLEYVNYYHVQLKHDSAADWRYLARHRRLREAPLRTDLRRECARAPQPGSRAVP